MNSNGLGEHGGHSQQWYPAPAPAPATFIMFNYLKELKNLKEQYGYKRLEEEPCDSCMQCARCGEEEKKKEKEKKEEENKSSNDTYADVYGADAKKNSKGMIIKLMCECYMYSIKNM